MNVNFMRRAVRPVRNRCSNDRGNGITSEYTDNRNTSRENANIDSLRPAGIWFAFLSADDELCENIPISDEAEVVRIIRHGNKPLFCLFYKKKHKILTPYDVLDLLKEERVSFPNDCDRRGFADDLSEALATYDLTLRGIDRGLHIAAAAAVIAAAAAVTAAAVAVIRSWK